MSRKADGQRLPLTIAVGERTLDAELLELTDSTALLVLAHGAGAGFRHELMERSARALLAQGIATFRYHFPYMQEGRRRPDPPDLLEATVRAATETARLMRPNLPLFAGGRSMGGRMTSRAQAKTPLADVRGLVFFAFPLHPPKKPGIDRAIHLQNVEVPMLFLSGDRDALARLDLLEAVTQRRNDVATLHVVAGADHSFRVLKRSGRTLEEVDDELGRVVSCWIAELNP